MDPPAILDPIIMTLSSYYQEPLCLEPLDADEDKNGKKADHKIVVSKPINTLNNKSCRQTRKIKVRPIPHSGVEKMKTWFIDKTWDEVYSAESAHEKAEIFKTFCFKKAGRDIP